MSQHLTVTADPDLKESFKDAMGNVAAAVAIVTAYGDDAPWGATVSAFMSLSMEPPMLLVSLQKTSSLLPRLTVGTDFGVNVLAADQGELATKFAQKAAPSHAQKYAGVSWSFRDGVPALDGTHAWVRLTVSRLVEAGDHVLVLGDVLEAEPNSREPLIYHQRAYGTHARH